MMVRWFLGDYADGYFFFECCFKLVFKEKTVFSKSRPASDDFYCVLRFCYSLEIFFASVAVVKAIGAYLKAGISFQR